MAMKTILIASNMSLNSKEYLYGVLKFIGGIASDTYTVATVLGKPLNILQK